MKTYNLLIAIIFILQSCTPPPIDTEYPAISTLTVMSSQFVYDSITDQSALIISLSTTFAPNEGNIPGIDSNGNVINDRHLITGAQLELSTASGTWSFTEQEKGIYYLFQPMMRVGDYGMLTVRDASGNQLMKAEQVLMPATNFSELSVTGSGGKKILSYELTDDTTRRNYYLVNYFVKHDNDTGGSFTDPVYLAKKLTEQRLDFDLFTDQDFTQGHLHRTITLPIIQADTMGVAISEISDGYYRFMEARKRHGLLINQIRGEIIRFPSNIIGGYGYFTLHNPHLRILKMVN